MEIRRARLDDVDAVVELVESAYRGESSRAGWTTEADLLDGQRADEAMVLEVLPHLLLALDGEQLLGCCALEPKEDHAYFGMFAVRPTLQGGGIGAALLDAAEEEARVRGLSEVRMTVLASRTELLAYYFRRGYTATGETRPFPYGDARFGVPRTDDLVFTVLTKRVGVSRQK